MENNIKLQRVTFEKDFLTLPDAIKEIAHVFNLSLNNKGSGDTGRNYKTIYKRLERELKAMNLEGTGAMVREGKRKTKYSRAVLEAVVNNNLYFWLCEKANYIQKEEFEAWKKAEASHGQKFSSLLALERRKDTYESEIAMSVEDEIKERKWKIVKDFLLDYVPSECIEIKEKLLREDVERHIYCETDHPGDYDIVIDEHLQNCKRYYTVKKRNRPECTQSIWK